MLGNNFYSNPRPFVKILGQKHPLVSRSVGAQLFSRLTKDKTYLFKSPYIGYTGKYALCTSAKCNISTDPNTKKPYLSCYCDVNNGTSFTPYQSGNNNYIYSLYSGINGPLLSKQTCTSGTWGDCLNQVCQVDNNNPSKAYCNCVPLNISPWITFQDKNDPTPCSCNNLSGAINVAYKTINDYYKLYVFL